MGCGTCPKKKVKLERKPSGLPYSAIEPVLEMKGERVTVSDAMGQKTVGRLLDLDFEINDDTIEDGEIFLRTVLGVQAIAMNIVESIEV